MTDEKYVPVTLLDAACGPHCGIKDGVEGHCVRCHGISKFGASNLQGSQDGNISTIEAYTSETDKPYGYGINPDGSLKEWDYGR